MRRRMFGALLLTSSVWAVFCFVVAICYSPTTDTLTVPSSTLLQSVADQFAIREVRLPRAELLLLLLCAAVFPMLLFYRQFTRWLFAIQAGVRSFAIGELNYRLPEGGPDEFSLLAELLNVMAVNLRARIDAVTRQKNELDAVLSSMAEGVLAIDLDGRIISLNRAAEKVLHLKAQEVSGQMYRESLPSQALQEVVEYALGNQEMTSDITLQGSGDQFINTLATPLRDAAGGCIGAVVLLHDVTDLRKLENVRRDFVANVSHELKTPITAIKGFVETLLGGAIADPADATRFLNIIGRQSDRLQAIIEDLLSLSRMEQQSEKAQLDKRPTNISEVLHSALEICGPNAQKKQIGITLNCPAELNAQVNPSLLEQAMINLIDNAIKYSEAKSPIVVAAREEDHELVLQVQDQGLGISKEHQGRVFERFYRVDKGRSRKMGGTGLGLAIVKHIAQVHGGSAHVESTLGQGSVFSIRLPLEETAVEANAASEKNLN